MMAVAATATATGVPTRINHPTPAVMPPLILVNWYITPPAT